MTNIFTEYIEPILPIIYIGGVLFTVATAADRGTNLVNAFFTSLLLTPFIGIICVYCTPSKEELKRRNDALQKQDEIIQLLRSKEINPSHN